MLSNECSSKRKSAELYARTSRLLAEIADERPSAVTLRRNTVEVRDAFIGDTSNENVYQQSYFAKQKSGPPVRENQRKSVAK